MSLIQTPKELAGAIRTQPHDVAEFLHRIARFGGQAVSCSVLQHLLAVHDMLATQPANVRLWALLHDCHEILTGDVVRPYVSDSLIKHQVEIDRQLRSELGITLSVDDAIMVERADIAAGNYEMQKVIAGRRVYNTPMPTADWVDAVTALLDAARIEAIREFLR
jgi:hypothetical protein